MDTNNSGLKSFLGLAVFGGIFMLVGGLVMLMAWGIIPAELSAPQWVVFMVGVAFAMSGMLVMINGLRDWVGTDNPFLLWVYNTLLLLFMIFFATPFHWVAFGAGERSFTSSSSMGGVTVSGSGSETGGRIAFGIGAILIDLLILWLMVKMVRGDDLGKSTHKKKEPGDA